MDRRGPMIQTPSLARHFEDDIADHRIGLALYLGRNDQEPAPCHREGRLEGINAGFGAGQWNVRGGHAGHPIGRHVEARLDDHRVRDRLSAGFVHQTHGDGGHVARLDFRLDGLEFVVVGAGESGAGQARCNREGGARAHEFPNHA